MAQLELRNLNKKFLVGGAEIAAVDNASLFIEKGEFLSIVGHSGSGKTTLISIIGGILRPTSGQVLFEGTDICAFDDNMLSEYRNTRIGFMFQFASLLPVLTARENVLLPAMFSRDAAAARPGLAEEYLHLVGLGDKVGAYPSQLSGGQQRRVAIARALAHSPEVILADEPTGDLDEETEADIVRLFKRVNEEKKVTIILITHNLDLASQAKKRLKMSQGVLAEI